MRAVTGARPLRWGIIGTGGMAAAFAEDLARLGGDAALVAVGSRARETAGAFADRFAIPRRHASAAALAADPEVDVAYVATPHALHREHSLLCLEAGKPVLCEKPFALSAREAREMVACARRRGLFLMEALWTRTLPAVREALALLAAGAIGAPRLCSADFGFHDEPRPGSILYERALGGGALLDVGVYPVALASWVLGRPERVEALARIGAGGVDEVTAAVLGYPGGALALLHAAIRLETPQEAVIAGDAGTLRLHAPWWKATRLTLARPGAADVTSEHPYPGAGFHLEAAEVARCLRAGLLESPLLPLDGTVAVMDTLDEIRARIGLRYPGEGA
jgi:predicted dehydrogenase